MKHQILRNLKYDLSPDALKYEKRCNAITLLIWFVVFLLGVSIGLFIWDFYLQLK